MILNSQVGGDGMNGAKHVLDSLMEKANTQNLTIIKQWRIFTRTYGYWFNGN
jgi:bisphosphoglycerate-dependent phosphoglycerate mutase